MVLHAGFIEFFEDSYNGTGQGYINWSCSSGDVTVTLSHALIHLLVKQLADTLTIKTLT